MGAQGIAPAALHHTIQAAYGAVSNLGQHHQRDPKLGLVDAGEFDRVRAAFQAERSQDPAGVAAALDEINRGDANLFTTAGGPSSGQQVADLVNAIARGDDYATFSSRYQPGQLQAPQSGGVRSGGRPRS